MILVKNFPWKKIISLASYPILDSISPQDRELLMMMQTTATPAAVEYLPFKKLITTSLGYKMKVYRSSAKDCGPCPLRSVCIGKSDFKKIDDSIDKPYYDRMHERLEKLNRNKIKKIRGSTVEPVLGTLVNYLAMRRVNTRGIKQANKCMLLAAVAYNLKKLMKFNERKVKTAI